MASYCSIAGRPAASRAASAADDEWLQRKELASRPEKVAHWRARDGGLAPPRRAAALPPGSALRGRTGTLFSWRDNLHTAVAMKDRVRPANSGCHSEGRGGLRPDQLESGPFIAVDEDSLTHSSSCLPPLQRA